MSSQAQTHEDILYLDDWLIIVNRIGRGVFAAVHDNNARLSPPKADLLRQKNRPNLDY
jgi:hypothetical protein